MPAINTSVVQVEDLSFQKSRVETRAAGPEVAADTVSGGPGDPTALAKAAPPGLGVTCSNTMTSIPDERVVWVTQRLRIRSTQNLVDADLDADATPHVSGGGGGYGAAVPDAGSPHPVQPIEAEENRSKARQRHRTRSCRDASSSATTVARCGPKMKRHDHTSLIRIGTNAAPGSMRTRSKIRVKAFDIRVEEYKEERRHVSHVGFHDLPRARRVTND